MPGPRAAVFDEALTLLRLLLEQDDVHFAGEFYQVDGVTIGPRPAKRLDVWLGGSAPAALRRAGRLSDGWLGSFLSPEQARAARIAIQHYGWEPIKDVSLVQVGAVSSAVAALRGGRIDRCAKAADADGFAFEIFRFLNRRTNHQAG